MSMASVPAPAVTWSITAQQYATQPGPAGQFVKGYLVSYVTGSGQQGQVFVPQTAYNPANVKELVSADAATMEAVAGLTHNS